ncbi:MAG: hypothetical protein ACMG6E_03150 [Candidatus Roizmanbacteria bacterium]
MDNTNQTSVPKEELIHTFPGNSTTASTSNTDLSIKATLIIFILAVVLGTVTGYGAKSFSKSSPQAGGASNETAGQPSSGKANKVVGVVDKKSFPDKAEGTLKEGGADGEGSFHLERPGGESQNVYLTSSIVDMSSYVNKKVRVWGQTFSSQKAGWLMDVGSVEILQ